MTIYAGFITLLYYPNLILNLLIYYDLMLCLLQINSWFNTIYLAIYYHLLLFHLLPFILLPFITINYKPPKF